MKRRFGFSIQAIAANGAPYQVGWKERQDKAVDLAEDHAKATGLEIRVWNTRRARVVHMIPAADYQEVA